MTSPYDRAQDGKKSEPRVVRYMLKSGEPVVGLNTVKEDAALVISAVQALEGGHQQSG